ncbi:MAG TPA: zinc dependent phospholipase C family protein [Firmicutes bacterium]|nr:zinc dependent phospholipase C family protein [Candidatus Fermentithermobacillaceae bacterium]
MVVQDMPFPMTHLIIARNILNATSQIKDPAQFLLGSIAPDAVHFRPDFESDMKKVSHLVVGDERWGWVTDNDGWRENVLTFLDLMKDEDPDFILGYCAHILADIKHNIEIWTPFRAKHEEEVKRGYSALHKEAVEVDFEIYRTCPDRQKIWELLERARPIDIPGIMEARDIKKARAHLLYKQYEGRKPVDVSRFKHVTVKTMVDLVEGAWKEIARELGLT